MVSSGGLFQLIAYGHTPYCFGDSSSDSDYTHYRKFKIGKLYTIDKYLTYIEKNLCYNKLIDVIYQREWERARRKNINTLQTAFRKYTNTRWPEFGDIIYTYLPPKLTFDIKKNMIKWSDGTVCHVHQYLTKYPSILRERQFKTSVINNLSDEPVAFENGNHTHANPISIDDLIDLYCFNLHGQHEYTRSNSFVKGVIENTKKTKKSKKAKRKKNYS